MPYSYQVQLRDTDAAGVVYFANLLAICHGAYESSLVAVGVDLKELVSSHDLAIPLIHASIDFHRPIYCGDRLQITLTPTIDSTNEFSVRYQIGLATGQVAGRAITKHVSIDPRTRQRHPLPQIIQDWLASAVPLDPT